MNIRDIIEGNSIPRSVLLEKRLIDLQVGTCEHDMVVRWNSSWGYQRHFDDDSSCEGWVEAREMTW